MRGTDCNEDPPALRRFDFARERARARLKDRITRWCFAWLPIQGGWALFCLSLVVLVGNRITGLLALATAVMVYGTGAVHIHNAIGRRIGHLEQECRRLEQEHHALVFGKPRRNDRNHPGG